MLDVTPEEGLFFRTNYRCESECLYTVSSLNQLTSSQVCHSHYAIGSYPTPKRSMMPSAKSTYSSAGTASVSTTPTSAKASKQTSAR